MYCGRHGRSLFPSETKTSRRRGSQVETTKLIRDAYNPPLIANGDTSANGRTPNILCFNEAPIN
jgi:hypothetical protein